MKGSLDRLRVRPGSKVTLEVRGTRTISLTIKVERKESFVGLSFRKPFQLITEYSRVRGIEGTHYQADSLTYRARLQKPNPVVEITGQPDSLVLILTLPIEKTIDTFSEGSVPITIVGYTRQDDETGVRLTTLVKDGEITYPDYPKFEKVSFKPPDFIGLDGLNKFSIDEIALDIKHKGIRFRLEGFAAHIRTGSPQFPKDHRLTSFDTLWGNPRLMVLWSIIVWLLPTTVGVYKLYKEGKGEIS